MEAGNRDQVGQPARAQGFPVLVFEAAGVAERERAQEPRGIGGSPFRDARRHRFAPGVEAACCADSLRVSGTGDVASRGDALCERIALGVETAGIAQAARCAQFRFERPAFAGMHRRRWNDAVLRLLAVVVPGELQGLATQGFRRFAIDFEAEARAFRFAHRQLDHAAGDLDDLSLHRRRQLRVQRAIGLQGAQAETEQQRSRDPRDSAAVPASGPSDDGQCRAPGRRERRQQQAGDATCEQGQRGRRPEWQRLPTRVGGTHRRQQELRIWNRDCHAGSVPAGVGGRDQRLARRRVGVVRLQ